MRCTCGYTTFDHRVKVTRTVDAERYLPPTPATTTGAGSMPSGVLAGTGSASYGRCILNTYTGSLQTRCSSCTRVRNARPIGGGMVLAVWEQPDAVYTLMSDVIDPACIIARFQSPTKRVDVGVEVVRIPFPELKPTHGVAASLPVGAVMGDVIYRVEYPSALGEEDDTFTLRYHDKCLRIVQDVGEVSVGGIIDLYGRTGDVVAEVGDYRTSQISYGEGMFDQPLDAMVTTIAGLPKVRGDLAWDSEHKLRVVAMHGRPVVNLQTKYLGYMASSWLRWSTVRNRWEWG